MKEQNQKEIQKKFRCDYSNITLKDILLNEKNWNFILDADKKIVTLEDKMKKN